MAGFEHWNSADLKANRGQPVRFQQQNPKQNGGAPWSRYEAYKVATTVGEYLDLNSASNKLVDFKYDLKCGFLTFPSGRSQPDAADRSCGKDAHNRNKLGAVAQAQHVKDEPAVSRAGSNQKPSKRARVVHAVVSGSNESRSDVAPTPSSMKAESQNATAAVAASVADPVSGSAPCAEVKHEVKPATTKHQDVLARKEEVPSCPTAIDEEATLASLAHIPPPPAPHAKPRRRKGSRSRSRGRNQGKNHHSSSSTSSSSSEPESRPASTRELNEAYEPLVMDGPPQLVCDVVGDYVVGQVDPAANEQSIRKTASYIPEGVPMAHSNRQKFVWVSRGSNASYTHDVESAKPLRRDQLRGRRCDVCGQKCAAKRVYRVRCYPRRKDDDLPEVDAPRIIRREIYQVGSRCMRALMGVPPVAAKQVVELRERLQGALRSPNFESEQWFEPLNHMARADGNMFKTVLEGELARVVKECSRPDAAWRKVARERKPAPDMQETAATVAERAFLKQLEEKETAATVAERAFLKQLEELEHTHRDVFVRTGSLVGTSEMRNWEEEEELLVTNGTKHITPPHVLYMSAEKSHHRQPYTLVIPSYGRPDRLQTATLAFLRRQGIPQNKIHVWLAPGKAPGQKHTEVERYKQALSKEWPDVILRIGVKGIMEQRWHIALQYPEGDHIVSLDDDIEDVLFKHTPGTSSDTVEFMPPGNLEALIHHANDIMEKENAYIWGLNPSSNPMNMVVDSISRKNGMLNAYFYGCRNRHDESIRSIFSSATEDVERSCRYFNKDGIQLRYLMYGAKTKFKAADGLALLYSDISDRKAAEEKAIEKIAAEFPRLLKLRGGADRRKGVQAMNCRFRSIGLGPLGPDGQSKVESMREELLKANGTGEDPEEFVKCAMQAQEEKLLLSRCIQLQDSLANVSDHRIGSTAVATQNPLQAQNDASVVDGVVDGTPSVNMSAPEVLDDILQIATSGKKTLKLIGLTPIPIKPLPHILPSTMGPPPAIETSIFPATVQSPPSQTVLAEGDAQALQEGGVASAQPFMAQHAALTEDSTRAAVASLSTPNVSQTSCGQTVSHLKADDVLAYEFRDFSRQVLNRRFTVDTITRISGRRSFWDQSRTVFMYWQQNQARWAISQRWDKNKDLLAEVRTGAEVGWAFQLTAGSWQEFWKGEWREVKMRPTIILRDAPAPAPVSGSMTPSVKLETLHDTSNSLENQLPPLVPLKGAPTITPPPVDVPLLPVEHTYGPSDSSIHSSDRLKHYTSTATPSQTLQPGHHAAQFVSTNAVSARLGPPLKAEPADATPRMPDAAVFNQSGQPSAGAIDEARSHGNGGGAHLAKVSGRGNAVPVHVCKEEIVEDADDNAAAAQPCAPRSFVRSSCANEGSASSAASHVAAPQAKPAAARQVLENATVPVNVCKSEMEEHAHDNSAANQPCAPKSFSRSSNANEGSTSSAACHVAAPEAETAAVRRLREDVVRPADVAPATTARSSTQPGICAKLELAEQTRIATNASPEKRIGFRAETEKFAIPPLKSESLNVDRKRSLHPAAMLGPCGIAAAATTNSSMQHSWTGYNGDLTPLTSHLGMPPLDPILTPLISPSGSTAALDGVGQTALHPPPPWRQPKDDGSVSARNSLHGAGSDG